MATLAKASLTPAERRALGRLMDLLRERLGDGLEAVWLYGSRARGEPPHEDSDVDLLVVTRRGSRDDAIVSDALREAAEDEGLWATFFSVQVANRGWLEERRSIDDFFIREVDRDKLILEGGEIEGHGRLHEHVEKSGGVRQRSREFLDSARDYLNSARKTAKAELPPATVWAAYYAMLNAARAALSEEDRYARTHEGTWKLFGELFVLTGRVEPAMVAPVKGIKKLREGSDYRSERPTQKDAEAAVANADRFVSAVFAALET